MKSNKIRVLLLLPVFFLAFTFSSVPEVFGSGWGVISEIALDESAPNNKWVEIYVVSETNIGGSRLYHRHNLSGSKFEHAFTFPSLAVSPGDYLVVEFNLQSTAPATSESWGYVFYSTYPSAGLGASRPPFSSQGAFYLTQPDGITWSDFMIFIREGTATFYMESEYDMAVSSGHWLPASEAGWGKAEYRQHVPGGTGSSTKPGWSIQRKNDLTTGRPFNTNTAGDWEFLPTTRGEGYFTAPAVEKALQVDNSPFFPHGESTPGEALISIKNSAASDRWATLTVFNTEGYAVRRLLRYEKIEAGTSQTHTWGGEDDYGKLLPMGIYVVRLELDSGDGSGRTVKQAPVVLGRRF